MMKTRFNIRLNEDTINKLNYLIDKYPNLYPTKSQAFRSSVHFLYNMRREKDGIL